MINRFEIVLGITISVICISVLLSPTIVTAKQPTPITSIKTDSGIIYPLDNGTIFFHGEGRTQIIGNGNQGNIVTNSSVFISEALIIDFIHSSGGFNYINSYFIREAVTLDEIRNYEPFDGKIIKLYITPIENDLILRAQPIILYYETGFS